MYFLTPPAFGVSTQEPSFLRRISVSLSFYISVKKHSFYPYA